MSLVTFEKFLFSHKFLGLAFFISRYFITFVTFVNGIFFDKKISHPLLLTYGRASDLGIFVNSYLTELSLVLLFAELIYLDFLQIVLCGVSLSDWCSTNNHNLETL